MTTDRFSKILMAVISLGFVGGALLIVHFVARETDEHINRSNQCQSICKLDPLTQVVHLPYTVDLVENGCVCHFSRFIEHKAE